MKLFKSGGGLSEISTKSPPLNTCFKVVLKSPQFLYPCLPFCIRLTYYEKLGAIFVKQFSPEEKRGGSLKEVRGEGVLVCFKPHFR